MPNAFYPKRSLLVPASEPHPKNTYYKVSIGEEEWDGKLHTVVKVQLLFNGKTAGRIVPSFPYNSDDAERVSAAIENIKDEYAKRPKVKVIPALPIKTVPKSYYVAALLKVPAGKITRWEDIELFLCKALGYERIKPDDLTIWPYSDNDNNEIPYWRVVGPYGYLPMRSTKYTIEHEELLLTREGLGIEPCGAGNKSRRVKDYKEYLFNFNSIDGSFLKTVTEVKSPMATLIELLDLSNENS